MPKTRGLGTSIHWLKGDFTGSPVAIGSLTSVGEISPEAEELDATTLDSAGGYREFIQGFKDSGELTLTGYHNKDDLGQAKCRTEFASGLVAYYYVTFPDASTVGFKAIMKGYTAGAADVDGLIGFGATLRISGAIQVITSKGTPTEYFIAPAATQLLDATASVLVPGAITYKWYSMATLGGSATVISAATSATYTVPAGTGTKYYYAEISVAGYYKTNSVIFTVTRT